MKLTAILVNPRQAHAVLMDLWRQIKPALLEGEVLAITVASKNRSDEQNAKLHAELAEVAHTVEWAGAKRDVDTWKRLMTAAWLRARGEGVEILPALDGHGVDVVFRRTSSLSVAECSELIEFVLAWKAEHMDHPSQ